MNINILEHDIVDLDIWYPLIAESEREFAPKVMEEPRECWEYLNDNPDVKMIECQVDGEMAATCIVIDSEFGLEGLHVFPKYRRMGLATKMVEYCYNRAGRLRLFTRQEEVHKICKKLGFERVGLDIGYYSQEEETIYSKKREMYRYTNEEYKQNFKTILNELETLQSLGKKIHLVAPMFGALPLATKLRNKLGCKCSLVKMSRYEEGDKIPEWIYKDDIQEDETLVIVDDLWDEGVTFTEVHKLVTNTYHENEVCAWALIGREEARPDWLKYTKEHPGEWISFPWE